MEFSEFIKITERHCRPEVLSQPGEVFFGSRNSLRKSNGVAIVGLNPGGNGLGTITQSLSLYEKNVKQDNFSGYMDSCWHDPYFSRNETCEMCARSLETHGTVHQDRHQKMVQKIADESDLDLRKTISLNAIWIQTRTASALSKYCKTQGKTTTKFFEENFLKVFEDLFQECGVNFVLCLGNGKINSSFALFRDALGAPSFECVSDNYRDGRFFTAKMNDRKITFFGIAHPSMHTTTTIGINAIKNQISNCTSGTPR